VRLSVETRSDLLLARRLLAYRGIEIGLYDSGSWMLYYHATCRHFGPATGMCRVHGQQAQPQVCRAYDPRWCWYRRVLLQGAGRSFLRLNPERFEYIFSRVTFDDVGEIYGVPDWETMIAGLSGIRPDGDGPEVSAEEPTEAAGPLECPSLEPWPPAAVCSADPWSPREEIIAGLGLDRCRALWVPLAVPRRLSELDLIAFRLGFRGVELTIGERGWGLLLNAPCRGSGTARCPRACAPAAETTSRDPAAGSGSRRAPSGRCLRLTHHSFAALRGVLPSSGGDGPLHLPSLSELRRFLASIGTPDGDRGDRPRPRSA
jgi:hypothetical protein